MGELLCVVPPLSLERALLRGEEPVARVGARATKIAATTFAIHPTRCSPILCGEEGGRFPVHVMIATLPIPASVGELVGVCRRLNQSHHSRVSPPLSGGTLVKCLEIAKISLK